MFDSGANCFLNALVREFEQWEYVNLPEKPFKSEGYTEGFRSKINNNQSFYLPLISYSIFGRSYFCSKQYLVDHSSGEITECEFLEFLTHLTKHPQLFSDQKLGTPDRDNLLKVIARSEESQANIKNVVDFRQNDLTKLFHQELSFINSEQSLLVGHSIHPCPKSRSGFSANDEKRYVPEYGNEFKLNWFAVDKAILYVFAGDSKSIEEYCQELVIEDEVLTSLANQLDSNHVLIPCHPWQAKHWEAHPELTNYFKQRQLRNLGQFGRSWRATSSLRSLYQESSPWMLKFSLSTQLTNSIRHLQPEEMIRGQVIEKVLSSHKAQEMEQEQPHFSIMREPISVALKGSNGKALDSTAIIWRQNPFHGSDKASQSTEVLSGLLQDLPNSPDNRLSLCLRAQADKTKTDPSHLAQAFLRSFLAVVIKPIIMAQAKYGLLFGAHQQNIVVTLDEQLMPIKTYFRDCQGTGFSGLAKQLYGEELLSDTADSGNLFENDTVIHLFTYYLLVNSCFNTISSLTLTKLLSEDEALKIYQEFLVQLKADNLPDPRVVDYLLDAEHIWSKGNFFCNLHAINENTMTDPFLIYHPLQNPLKAATKVAHNAA